jgi:hypothetical protein
MLTCLRTTSALATDFLDDPLSSGLDLGFQAWFSRRLGESHSITLIVANPYSQHTDHQMPSFRDSLGSHLTIDMSCQVFCRIQAPGAGSGMEMVVENPHPSPAHQTRIFRGSGSNPWIPGIPVLATHHKLLMSGSLNAEKSTDSKYVLTSAELITYEVETKEKLAEK